jgi:hypothetical protein
MGGPNYLEKKLSLCHDVHHSSYVVCLKSSVNGTRKQTKQKIQTWCSNRQAHTLNKTLDILFRRRKQNATCFGSGEPSSGIQYIYLPM